MPDALVLTMPALRLAQRLLAVLTVGCVVYLVYFWTAPHRQPVFADEGLSVSLHRAAAPISLDLQPYAFIASLVQARNIFSPPVPVAPANATPVQPTGQLPSNLKVVAIVISQPSEVVIEDTSMRQTYFITKGQPQGGISLVRADNNQAVIAYQGQNISIPVDKPNKTP